MRRLAFGMAALGGILLCAALSAMGQKADKPGDAAPDNPGASCLRTLLLTFDSIRHGEVVRQTPIWKSASDSSFFFEAGMTIDADGAPTAYNADNTGLDDLANAGSPEHWDGLVVDPDGNPLVQGEDDPAPGFYVSCTALGDRTKAHTDPARYVDASKIPYIVLPPDVARQMGARLGDFAVVTNLRNGKSSYGIFADIGTLGEGSIALAENLGISSNARRGGAAEGIMYRVFPGSGDGRPKTIEEINTEAAKLAHGANTVETAAVCAID